MDGKNVAKCVTIVAVQREWHKLQHYFLRMCINCCTFASELTQNVINPHEKEIIYTIVLLLTAVANAGICPDDRFGRSSGEGYR